MRRFWLSAGKINVQLEDKYYQNEKNASVWKMYNNFRFSVQILAK